MSELVSEQFDWLGTAPIEYKFYDDTISVFYSDEAHSYIRYEEGVEVVIPGVTTAVHIIDKSAALTQWAANMACNFMRDEMEMFLVMNGAQWRDMNGILFEEMLGKAKYHHKNYKEKAGETGHIAHNWIEDYIKALIAEDWNKTVELMANLPEEDRARNGCIASLDWMAKHRVKWVSTEQKIYSKEHDYAGTMDGLAYVTSCGDKDCCGEIVNLVKVASTFKDVLAVIDWKTSNGLYPEYEYQTGAYTKAINEMLGLGVELRFIIRLGKEDAAFESKFLPPERLQDDVDTFLGCLHLHRIVERRKAVDKSFKDAVKAAARAEKDAAEAAEKARKAARREFVRETKIRSKEMYKQLRAEKVSVVDATAKVEATLAAALRQVAIEFGDDPDEEELEIAA